MDQINPFTNAPTNPPQPPPTAEVPPPPAQPAKPAAPKTSAPKKKPSEIDIKHIIKTIVLVVIGIVIAKLAFDSVMPKPAPAVKGSKTTAVQKSGVPRLPTVSRSGKKGKEELSLSETFAAAKRTPRPAPVQAEPFVVNGVFLSEGGGTASAIVNNKVVQVGDTVDGAVVKSITEEGVELMRVDEIIKLRYR